MYSSIVLSSSIRHHPPYAHQFYSFLLLLLFVGIGTFIRLPSVSAAPNPSSSPSPEKYYGLFWPKGTRSLPTIQQCSRYNCDKGNLVFSTILQFQNGTLIGLSPVCHNLFVNKTGVRPSPSSSPTPQPEGDILPLTISDDIFDRYISLTDPPGLPSVVRHYIPPELTYESTLFPTVYRSHDYGKSWTCIETDTSQDNYLYRYGATSAVYESSQNTCRSICIYGGSQLLNYTNDKANNTIILINNTFNTANSTLYSFRGTLLSNVTCSLDDGRTWFTYGTLPHGMGVAGMSSLYILQNNYGKNTSGTNSTTFSSTSRTIKNNGILALVGGYRNKELIYEQLIKYLYNGTNSSSSTSRIIDMSSLRIPDILFTTYNNQTCLPYLRTLNTNLSSMFLPSPDNDNDHNFTNTTNATYTLMTNTKDIRFDDNGREGWQENYLPSSFSNRSFILTYWWPYHPSVSNNNDTNLTMTTNATRLENTSLLLNNSAFAFNTTINDRIEGTLLLVGGYKHIEDCYNRIFCSLAHRDAITLRFRSSTNTISPTLVVDSTDPIENINGTTPAFMHTTWRPNDSPMNVTFVRPSPKPSISSSSASSRIRVQLEDWTQLIYPTPLSNPPAIRKLEFSTSELATSSNTFNNVYRFNQEPYALGILIGFPDLWNRTISNNTRDNSTGLLSLPDERTLLTPTNMNELSLLILLSDGTVSLLLLSEDTTGSSTLTMNSNRASVVESTEGLHIFHGVATVPANTAKPIYYLRHAYFFTDQKGLPSFISWSKLLPYRPGLEQSNMYGIIRPFSLGYTATCNNPCGNRANVYSTGCSNSPYDAQCKPCTVCPPKQYALVTCGTASLNSFSDTICRNCAVCNTSNNEIQVFACTATSNTVCVVDEKHPADPTYNGKTITWDTNPNSFVSYWFGMVMVWLLTTFVWTCYHKRWIENGSNNPVAHDTTPNRYNRNSTPMCSFAFFKEFLPFFLNGIYIFSVVFIIQILQFYTDTTSIRYRNALFDLDQMTNLLSSYLLGGMVIILLSFYMVAWRIGSLTTLYHRYSSLSWLSRLPFGTLITGTFTFIHLSIASFYTHDILTFYRHTVTSSRTDSVSLSFTVSSLASSSTTTVFILLRMYQVLTVLCIDAPLSILLFRIVSVPSYYDRSNSTTLSLPLSIVWFIIFIGMIGLLTCIYSCFATGLVFYQLIQKRKMNKFSKWDPLTTIPSVPITTTTTPIIIHNNHSSSGNNPISNGQRKIIIEDNYIDTTTDASMTGTVTNPFSSSTIDTTCTHQNVTNNVDKQFGAQISVSLSLSSSSSSVSPSTHLYPSPLRSQVIQQMIVTPASTVSDPSVMISVLYRSSDTNTLNNNPLRNAYPPHLYHPYHHEIVSNAPSSTLSSDNTSKNGTNPETITTHTNITDSSSTGISSSHNDGDNRHQQQQQQQLMNHRNNDSARPVSSLHQFLNPDNNNNGNDNGNSNTLERWNQLRERLVLENARNNSTLMYSSQILSSSRNVTASAVFVASPSSDGTSTNNDDDEEEERGSSYFGSFSSLSDHAVGQLLQQQQQQQANHLSSPFDASVSFPSSESGTSSYTNEDPLNTMIMDQQSFHHQHTAEDTTSLMSEPRLVQ